ncbi:hypothetical protein DL95DRAFT_492845 [Leptodontidium sp. 2 PMI_412]|nr:hypothetical protein DL95DRAFT_492845 [Leptodontidium sp. 2 PMI_412]
MFGSYRDTITSLREGKDGDGPEAEPFIFSDSMPQKQRTAWGIYLTALHSITTVVLAFICIGLLLHGHGAPGGSGFFEGGFKTELSYMFPVLELEEKTFHFLKSGEEDTHRDYIGRRAPDIDHAWNKLLHCESVSWPGVVTQYEAKTKAAANLDFTDDEAGPELRNTTWKWEDMGYWFSGVSMWYQLHCLNFLREAGHWDTYDGPPGPPVQFHLDHCVNYLRQVVMCYADLMPMRYGWDEGAGRLVLQDEPHTCRNYEKIDELARPPASCHNLDFSKPKGWGTSPRGTCVRGPYFKDV